MPDRVIGLLGGRDSLHLGCVPDATVVVPAGRADLVRQARRVALFAGSNAGCGKFIVGAAFRLPRTGMASLGKRHRV